jgi:PAS domain S-box-containing protein
MDGLEFCRRLKACKGCRDVPVMFISASTEVRDLERGFAMGAVDFVSKPIRREELLARIRTHLELSRLHINLEAQVERRTAELHIALDRLQSEMTERARTVETLRGKEELFRAMFEQASLGVVQSTLDGNVLAVNRRFCEMVGYSAGELIEKHFCEITHPEDNRRNAEYLRRLLAHEIPSYRIEKRYIRKDGNIVWVSLYGSLLRLGSDHTPRRLLAIVEDITDRKSAGERLERQSAFDNLVRDLLTRFATCSAPEIDAAIAEGLRVLSEFVGADYGYVIQLSGNQERWSVTHEWCGSQTPAFACALQNVPTAAIGWLARRTLTGEVVQVDDMAELPPEAEADREFHLQRGVVSMISAPIENTQGRVFGVVGVHKRSQDGGWATGDAERLRTISGAIAGILQRKGSEIALRESEERFRSVADTAPVVIWGVDPQRKLTFCNQHGLSFFGKTLTQLAAASGDLVHPHDLRAHYGSIATALKSHEPFTVELRLKRVDGEQRWMLVSGIPRFVEATYRGHVGTAVDITDIKHTYERHVAAQKLESLGVLAAGISHEFNNLLGSIIAGAESLSVEIATDSQAREDVEKIRKVAFRAAEIVSQLMAFAGQESQIAAVVELSPLVTEMTELLKISIAKTAVLDIHLEKDLPAVRANAGDLRQVILSLVTNASEALGDKAGSITIATRRSTAIQSGTPAEYVELEVADTGCGMTDDQIVRIFDPFFTTKFPGRGLGLSAVQGIVSRCGGLINVESTPGGGSRFRVLLPPTTERPREAPVISAPDVSSVTGTVLLVEDEETLRLTTSRMLRRRGFEVIEAADGRAAIELFQTNHASISVVFLDLTLPKIRGADVLTRLRAIRPDTKVVLSSGYSRERVMAEIGTNAISGFIRKPYTISDVVTGLSAALSA